MQVSTTHQRSLFSGLLLLAWMVLAQGGAAVQAQDPQFTQFYAAPLYLAPSFAGGTDGSRAVMNYRNQWPQIPGAFVTYSFSLDHYFHNYNSGVGVLFSRDQAGAGNLAATNAGIQYSYNFKLDHLWTLRPGVHFLYSQRTVDFYRHVFGDQLNLDGNHNPASIMPPPIDNVGYFDASSSVMAYTPNLWVGLNVDHLMRPDQSMTNEQARIPMRFSLFGGYRFDYGGSFFGNRSESISVAVLFKKQEKFNQLDAGVYWSKDPISLGLLYRGIPVFNNHVHGLHNNDAVAVMAGLRYENLRIGYSYDMTISRLITSTGGSHEVSLIYHFNQGPPNKRAGKMPCPD
ncbi:MAG: type IX secretion system membrane protein PorP/SprF [Bacteroidales bacterium]